MTLDERDAFRRDRRHPTECDCDWCEETRAPRVPEWRKRLQAQDRTGEIRHNG